MVKKHYFPVLAYLNHVTSNAFGTKNGEEIMVVEDLCQIIYKSRPVV